MVKIETTAFDSPDSRDYKFEDFLEYAEWEWKKWEWPEQEIKVFNQGSQPSCTVHAAMHCINALNLNEDRVNWYPPREQIDPSTIWEQYCAERGDYNSWSSIQTIASWMKRKWYIEWYVTLSNDVSLEKMQDQLDKALTMWVIYTGSAWGDWNKIKKTGIYSESNPKYFMWHARNIVIIAKEWDYYKCMNSYWENRWPYKWYFLLHKNDINKIYSKILFIDKDDSALFKNFIEIQKIKQAINLFRVVYHTTTNVKLQQFLESVQMGKNFSEILWVQI